MNQNNERRADAIEAEKPENAAAAPAPHNPSEGAGKPQADIAVETPARKEPDRLAQPGAAVPGTGAAPA